MAKNKRLKNVKKPQRMRSIPHPRDKPSKITKHFTNASATSNSKSKSSNSQHAPQHAPPMPFHPYDHILLLGEGDFSFSAALCSSRSNSKIPHPLTISATTFETRDALLQKHPQASKHLQTITSEAPLSNSQKALATTPNAVFYNVDATRLSKCKPVIRRGPYDRIVFNFPHVGGKSTDVNRQVRANQEMVVGFLREAMTLLRRQRKTRDVQGEQIEDEDQEAAGERYDTPPSSADEAGDDVAKVVGGDATLAAHASILVTLFEGHPYTLWNIRDLARHVGLRVERSFRFDATAYSGYRHARTLGNLKGGAYEEEEEDAEVTEEKEEKAEGKDDVKQKVKRKAGWRGEERPARVYEFVIDEGEESAGKKKKRKREDSDDSEDSG